eukprot:scaffold255408_cov36-Tisochrysis_lutea.AAC.2
MASRTHQLCRNTHCPHRLLRILMVRLHLQGHKAMRSRPRNRHLCIMDSAWLALGSGHVPRGGADLGCG